MSEVSKAEKHVQTVSNFNDLVSTPFEGEINAMCWKRALQGDFSEIVKAVELHGNMIELETSQLRELQLSEQGMLARDILLNDLKLLKEHGASPMLNIIRNYDRDDSFPYFPTDVYSFHVDRSPIPSETFLCTYYGTASEIVPNEQATQKVLIPEIRAELKKFYGGTEESFESFLTENFFDLHYQVQPGAQILNLGIGHIWKLAIDHPNSKVLPCVHRAPLEKPGESRLLLIC